MAIVASSERSVRARLEEEAWRAEMRSAVRDPVRLCRMLDLPAVWERAAERAASALSVLAPLDYIRRMRRGDPDDPLLRQVLPLREELDRVPGFSADPVGDGLATLAPGLLQKYAGRALLATTGACAIHCRYCFRRHDPCGAAPRSESAWRPALERIAADSQIEEVVLSGGDPLTLSNSRLARLTARLGDIPHVQRLRVHTRAPIVLPSRVTEGLLNVLHAARPTVCVVVHANHPAELSESVAGALGRLADAGLPILNQSVLLRGVNDNVETLRELCRRLANHRVTPYYLHQLDRVAGAAHFETPIDDGIRLIQELRRRLPGWTVPRYVREVPGEPSKQVLA